MHTAAALGADGVEIDLRTELPAAELTQTALRQVRKLLDDLNLRVAAVAYPTRRGYDEPEDLDRRIMATGTTLRLAYQLGSKVVVNRVGPVPEDSSHPRFGRLVQSLTVLAALGEREGARLAAQTGTEPGEQLARLLEAVPSETIGVDLNPSSLILGGHSPEEAVQALGQWVLHVHACDAVRDLGLGRGVEVDLGRGTADLPALLGQLEAFDYHGWVTVQRHDSPDPITDVGNAVAYLRTL